MSGDYCIARVEPLPNGGLDVTVLVPTLGDDPVELELRVERKRGEDWTATLPGKRRRIIQRGRE